MKNDSGSVASVLPFTNVAFQQVACDSKRFCVVSEVEEAMKDHWKNVARNESLALVPVFERPKPKIPFLGRSLLRNNTETLAS